MLRIAKSLSSLTLFLLLYSLFSPKGYCSIGIKSYLCIVFRKRHNILFAQSLCRTSTSNEIIRANSNTNWSVRIERRLLHMVFEAVLGLAESMAGLRFSYPIS